MDVIKVLEGQDEEAVVNAACEEAKQRAVDAGADPATVKIIELDNMPLQYVQMRANRIIARAAGALSKNVLLEFSRTAQQEELPNTWTRSLRKTANTDKDLRDFIVSPSALIDVTKYRPNVDKDGRWWVSEVDLEFLATGCSILACGGGGPGYMCYMAGRAALKSGKRLCIVDVNTLPDDEYILGSISYGAPTVTTERLPSGSEAIDATDALLQCHPGLKMAAQAAIEIGGMNGIRPMLTGLHYDVPAIDGDFMGRAYPRIYLLTPFLYDCPATPCTQADGMGNVVTVNKCQDMRKLEKIHRKAGNEMGLFSQLVIPPLTVRETKKVGTLGTTSLAWYIGRAVYMARQQNTSIPKAIVSKDGT